MTYDNALPCPTFNLDAATEMLPEAAPAPVPADYVMISRAELERMLALVAETQTWQADYERLREKERVELLEPLPIFLSAKPGGVAEPVHCIPRLARGNS